MKASTGKKYFVRCHDCHETINTDHKAIADEFVRVHKEMRHVAKAYVAKGNKSCGSGSSRS